MTVEVINAVTAAVRDTGGPLVIALGVLWILYKQLVVLDKLAAKVDACHDDVLRIRVACNYKGGNGNGKLVSETGPGQSG